jgi:hypothetical protein
MRCAADLAGRRSPIIGSGGNDCSTTADDDDTIDVDNGLLNTE